MAAVSARGEWAAVKSRCEMRIVSALSHDACTGSMSNRDVRAWTTDVSATTTDVSATAKMSTTAAVSTAVSGGSLRRKRQAAKRENCGQRKN
jgi:hypothetical protein